MPFKVEARFDDLKPLLDRLGQLPRKLARKALRRAVTIATRKLARAAKDRAKGFKRTGTLWKSLGSKVKVYASSGAVVGIVGARQGFRTQIGVAKKDSAETTRYPRKTGDPIYANPVKYLHLVELGTHRSRANPFLADALRATRSVIKATLVEEIDRGLSEALRK